MVYKKSRIKKHLVTLIFTSVGSRVTFAWNSNAFLDNHLFWSSLNYFSNILNFKNSNLEPIFRISGICYSSHITVWIDNAVASLNSLSISFLLSVLIVCQFVIFDIKAKVVLGIWLKKRNQGNFVLYCNKLQPSPHAYELSKNL